MACERWQRQLETFDCLPTCLACLLGLPVGSIPNYYYEKDTVECYQHWLTEHTDYWLLTLSTKNGFYPPGLWIATVPARQDPENKLHAVIARGKQLVHDPTSDEHWRYSRRRFTWVLKRGKVEQSQILVPRDPKTRQGEPEDSP